MNCVDVTVYASHSQLRRTTKLAPKFSNGARQSNERYLSADFCFPSLRRRWSCVGQYFCYSQMLISNALAS